MTDNFEKSSNNLQEMGATSNNSSRITALQERKKQIEETLAKRNQELRELCMQELEITGIAPSEMPLEIGETPPTVRRIVGTTFQLPETLVQNSSNKDETIQSLELQIQVHANLAEAALGLANENNVSKTIKKQHRSEYQKHKNQCIVLQEKLAFLKEKQLAEPPKQRKKPRAVDVVKQQQQQQVEGHNYFLNNNNNDPGFKQDLRYSMRYMKTNDANAQTMEYYRYAEDLRMYPRPNSELPYPTQQRYDDIFSGIYSLSLNGYNKYMERRESYSNVSPNYDAGLFQYNHDQFQQTNPYYNVSSQHSSQNSPQLSHHNKFGPHNHAQMQTLYYPQRSPQHHSHQTGHSKYFDYSNPYNYGSGPKSHKYAQSLHGHGQNYQNDSLFLNPHQIQPHQQYEQTGIISSGLGGCWRKNERGELVWSTNDVSWQKDKRFGSLDRRKNKRITKMSANVDNKSATLGGVPSSQDQVLKNVPVNAAVISRRSADRQLVRTQSLGSVGAQTLDSVYPSDDNSSCGSEKRNRSNSQTLQKCRKKEWVETALDGPVSTSKRQSPLNFKPPPLPPVVLAPEEKYYVNNTPPPLVVQTPPKVASPVVAKPPLEIPAESNPSPRLPENNEFFSSPVNNQNFTVVQAGQCKPYHEETKPFEMSDFYKYSTKFKKSEQSKVKGNEQVPEQNMNQAYSPKRFYGSPSHVATVDNAQYVNASFEHANANDVSRWYENQQIHNPGNRTEGRFPDTLV